MNDKKQIQLIYEFDIIDDPGLSMEDYAKARDPESKCLLDEILRCNDPALNGSQFMLTRAPEPLPSMEAPTTERMGGGERTNAQREALRRGADPAAAEAARAHFMETIEEDQEDQDDDAVMVSRSPPSAPRTSAPSSGVAACGGWNPGLTRESSRNHPPCAAAAPAALSRCADRAAHAAPRTVRYMSSFTVLCLCASARPTN